MRKHPQQGSAGPIRDYSHPGARAAACPPARAAIPSPLYPPDFPAPPLRATKLPQSASACTPWHAASLDPPRSSTIATATLSRWGFGAGPRQRRERPGPSSGTSQSRARAARRRPLKPALTLAVADLLPAAPWEPRSADLPAPRPLSLANIAGTTTSPAPLGSGGEAPTHLFAAPAAASLARVGPIEQSTCRYRGGFPTPTQSTGRPAQVPAGVTTQGETL